MMVSACEAPRLCDARPCRHGRRWLRFDDGSEGEIDVTGEPWGEVFQPLNGPATFARGTFNAELGTVVWPTGADLAPEFLYQRLRPATATPVR